MIRSTILACALAVGALCSAPATLSAAPLADALAVAQGWGYGHGGGWGHRGGGWHHRHGWHHPGRGWGYGQGRRFVHGGPRVAYGRPFCRTVIVERYRPRLGIVVQRPVRVCS